ncbi:MAG: DUF4358 domain-containing protein [Clostridia bacterium]|nr:DUF4358 domain-containing protein [Clostridia bacterium]
MKKIIKLFVIAVSLCTFAGCNGSNNSSNISISTVYSGISPMAEGTLVEMNDNYISNYYGIDVADLQEYVFAQSDDPKSAETIIIFKCQDGEKRKLYVQAVENALNQKYDELTNYDLPDEAKLVKQSKIRKSDDLVYLVISDKSKEMNKIIKDSIS